MAALKHLHKYQRSKTNRNYFRCVDSDCTHRDSKDSIDGKNARCPSCGGTFQLDREALRRRDPKCLNCSNTKQARAMKERIDAERTLPVAEAGKPVRRGRPKLPPEEKLKRMISKLPLITEDYAQEVIEKLRSVKVNPDLA